MFDSGGSTGSGGGSALPVDAVRLAGWSAALADIDRDATDAERIDQIRELEVLKCAAEAAQAVLAADFEASQRAHQAAAGVPAARQGRGIAEQVALARRESPHKGRQHLGLAKVLVSEMPNTLAALRAGQVTEWRATLLARETGCLSLADRRQVDRTLAGDADRISAMGDREIVAAARKLAYRLDPHAVVARSARAEADRCVTIRPAPDTMTYLTGLLPVAQGVAVHAALNSYADQRRAAGDPRGRGQIMADTLVERVTGQASGDAVPIRVNLTVSDAVLFGDADEPGHLEGYGPVPAGVARGLLARSLSAKCKTWLRRLYQQPGTGRLVAMDSKSRLVPAALGEFVEIRDQVCRTPWCDAPIRHHDHVVAVTEDGETSEVNSQGLCESCNHAKQAPGWSARPRPGPRHSVETRTPTSHAYWSTAPPRSPTDQPVSRIEAWFAQLVLAG
jgi:hypothetical protein